VGANRGGLARAGKDRVGGSSTGALCTGFTLVYYREENGSIPPKSKP